MKLEQIIDPVFNQALNELMSKPVPMIVAYNLSDILEKVAKENKKFQELREKLLTKYGSKDKAGKLLKNDEGTAYLIEDKAGFEADYQELVEIEVELPFIKVDDIKDLKLSTITVTKLKGLIRP